MAKQNVLVFAALLAGMLLSGCTQDLKVCSGGTASTGFENFFQSWEGVVFAGVVLIMLACALAYMISGIVASNALREWAKNQMAEAFMTILLAAFLIGITGFFCGLDASEVTGVHVEKPPLVGGLSQLPADLLTNSIFTNAKNTGQCNSQGCFANDTNWDSGTVSDIAYIQLQYFRNSMYTGIAYLFGISMFVEIIQDSSIRLQVAKIGPTFNFAKFFEALVTGLNTGITLMGLSMLSASVQMLVLKVSEKLYLFLLPAGLILRAFGFTRGLGGALIAVAIGLYMIYPISIVIFYGMINGGSTAYISQFTNTDMGVGTNTALEFLSILTGANAIVPSSDPFYLLTHPGTVMNILTTWNNGLCGIVGFGLVGAALVPFLSFMITASFVTGLSRAIGDRFEFGNLSVLIGSL